MKLKGNESFFFLDDEILLLNSKVEWRALDNSSVLDKFSVVDCVRPPPVLILYVFAHYVGGKSSVDGKFSTLLAGLGQDHNHSVLTLIVEYATPGCS
jgi:hypothetical protein